MTIAERLGRGKKPGFGGASEEEVYIAAAELPAPATVVPPWKRPETVLVAVLLALVSSASFGLGMLADKEGSGMTTPTIRSG